MHGAVLDIKSFQSQRFRYTYRDLLAKEPHAGAVRFFLDELYGSRDFQSRDDQFVRIAGALQRLLPRATLGTVVALAELHELTEQLDHAMAARWMNSGSGLLDANGYRRIWQSLNRPGERERQLALVLNLGQDLAAQVTTPGLRLLVRAMHRPAHAAGLGSIQNFLERGMDAFLALERVDRQARQFLAIIQTRETALIGALTRGTPEESSSLLGT